MRRSNQQNWQHIAKLFHVCMQLQDSRHYGNDLPDSLYRATSSSSSSGGEAYRTSLVPIAVVSDDLFKEAIGLLGFEFEPEKEEIAKTLLGLTIPAEAATSSHAHANNVFDLTDEPSFSSVSSSIESVTNHQIIGNINDFDAQSSVATGNKPSAANAATCSTS